MENGNEPTEADLNTINDNATNDNDASNANAGETLSSGHPKLAAFQLAARDALLRRIAAEDAKISALRKDCAAKVKARKERAKALLEAQKGLKVGR